MFDFVVEDTQEKPTVTFRGEEPYLQYVSDRVHNTELIRLYTISLPFVLLQNFLVTGKCIGQPNYIGDCKYESHSITKGNCVTLIVNMLIISHDCYMTGFAVEFFL